MGTMPGRSPTAISSAHRKGSGSHPHVPADFQINGLPSPSQSVDHLEMLCRPHQRYGHLEVSPAITSAPSTRGTSSPRKESPLLAHGLELRHIG